MVSSRTIGSHKAIFADVSWLNSVFNRVCKLIVTAEVLADQRPSWTINRDVVFKQLIGNTIHITAINALEDHTCLPFVVIIHTQWSEYSIAHFSVFKVWTVYTVWFWYNYFLLTLTLTVQESLFLTACTAYDHATRTLLGAYCKLRAYSTNILP